MDLIRCYCWKETHKDPSEDTGGIAAFPEDSCTQHNSAGFAGLWRKCSGCKRPAQCICHFSDPRWTTRPSLRTWHRPEGLEVVWARTGQEQNQESSSLKQQILLPPPLHSHAQLSDRYRNSYPSLTCFTGMCSKVIS